MTRMCLAMMKASSLFASSVLALSLVSGCAQSPGQANAGADVAQQSDAPSGDETSGNKTSSPAKEASQASTVPEGDESPVGEEPRASLTEDMVPVASQLPIGRTMDEVASALGTYVTETYPDKGVRSVEIYGNESDGQEAWISYLVRFDDNHDIGVEVTCSSATAPLAQEKDVIRVFGNRTYNVKTKEYEDFQDTDVRDDEPVTSSQTSDSGGDYVKDKTEGTPPEKTPVLVSDDNGNMVWVAIGDL